MGKSKGRSNKKKGMIKIILCERCTYFLNIRLVTPLLCCSLPTQQMNRNASSTMDPAKRNELALLNLLKIESNKYCADCGQKGNN
jgi:hypothetical protein